MPKKYLILLLLVLTLCVAAVLFYYARSQKVQPEFYYPRLPENVQPELSQAQKIADTVTEILSSYGDRQALIGSFGEPKKITKENVENLHNPEVIDEIIGFVYDDIEFKIYKGNENIRDFIYQVIILSDKYPLKNGLRVGDGKENILAILGKPDELSRENILYEGALSRINFHLKNGIVDKIYVVRYID